jgi:hypothetical protein
VIQTIIQPRVVGVTVGLSATLSFLSLIIWATILGAPGAFLAVPLSLFVKSLFVDVDPEHDWVAPLLSSEKSGETAEPGEVEGSDAGEPGDTSIATEPALEPASTEPAEKSGPPGSIQESDARAAGP